MEERMKEKGETFNDIKASIEQLRDEIKLKAHLGEQETKDELARLEKKWEHFLSEYKPVLSEAEKTAKNAGAALGLAADEIKAGYERIRKLF
jgi:chromosome condensin MukBEF complex kleisin-like MukF subunit